MDIFLECVLFVVGLAFGSFLNVCISRIPREQSIITPRSQCPTCGAAIVWYDNVPLLSWFVLRGRCRSCGQRISWRYPVVELLTAVLLVTCYAYFGLSWLTLKFCTFCFLLVGLIFMDAETGLLPREFTYSGIVIGFVFSLIAPTDSAATLLLLRASGWSESVTGRELWLLDSLLGALVGAAFFYLAWAVYYLVRKRHGLGFGDIALMAMSGAFLGLKLTIFVLFAAPLTGVLYAVTLLPGRRNAQPSAKSGTAAPNAREMFLFGELPFGVFLGGCSITAVFFGENVWRWYLGFF